MLAAYPAGQYRTQRLADRNVRAPFALDMSQDLAGITNHF